MRVLVITDVLWRNDNSVGNSYSNIFEELLGVEVANICCQEGQSENNVSKQCFQISESRLLKHLRNNNIPTGVIEEGDNVSPQHYSVRSESKFIRILKRSRWQILFWIRNLIWRVGAWNSKELNEFIDGFKPDIVFGQLQDKIYLNKLVEYVHEYTKTPLVLYVWDDVYSLKQFSFSPLYWVDRLIQRKSIRKLVSKCELLYTISCEQKEEYKRYFEKHTEVLYKGKDFSKHSYTDREGKAVLNVLYTGNLYSGRYETILKLCQKIHQQNKNELKMQLFIYSGTDLSEKQIKKINIGNSTFFKGNITEQEVQVLQKEADILLHIEPMNLRGSLLCRLSFSTKLVDYFYNGKCILAVGNSRCSAIRYLKKYDAAVVAESIDEAESKLIELMKSPEKVNEYAKKAWNCGCKNHQIKFIQQRLKRDLDNLVQEKKDNECSMDNE